MERIADMPEKILIVDDEVEIADLIELYLKNENYTVLKFYTATEALECINTTTLDLAILDIMLPDINGFTLCQKIRERYTYPIIMLTAKDGETDKITGLTLGADDYMTKPFRPLKMVARVKSQLRRYKKYNAALPEETQHVILYSDLTLDKIAQYRQEGYAKEEAVKEAEQWVAVPGYSEHQLGIAVDINGATYDLYLWLQQNSYKYGFIFRYPGAKTDLTGIAEEIWHYRYVGVEAATEIYQQGICLEEYLDKTET